MPTKKEIGQLLKNIVNTKSEIEENEKKLQENIPSSIPDTDPVTDEMFEDFLQTESNEKLAELEERFTNLVERITRMEERIADLEKREGSVVAEKPPLKHPGTVGRLGEPKKYKFPRKTGKGNYYIPYN